MPRGDCLGCLGRPGLRRRVRNFRLRGRAVLRELDPKGRVRLVESLAVGTPLLLGVIHPLVALPAGVTDPDRLRDILAHELTHVRRKDLLVKTSDSGAGPERSGVETGAGCTAAGGTGADTSAGTGTGRLKPSGTHSRSNTRSQI